MVQRIWRERSLREFYNDNEKGLNSPVVLIGVALRTISRVVT